MLYKQESRKVVANRLYQNVRSKLPAGSLVLGSLPIDGEWQGWDFIN